MVSNWVPGIEYLAAWSLILFSSYPNYKTIYIFVSLILRFNVKYILKVRYNLCLVCLDCNLYFFFFEKQAFNGLLKFICEQEKLCCIFHCSKESVQYVPLIIISFHNIPIINYRCLIEQRYSFNTFLFDCTIIVTISITKSMYTCSHNLSCYCVPKTSF